MSEPIRPALAPEEWREAMPRPGEDARITERIARDAVQDAAYHFRFHAAVALANAALPDDDPRKITADEVNALRGLAIVQRPEMAAFLNRLAAKLAAVLPAAEPLASDRDPADAADRLGRRMGV